ncbi:MAG: helix-turn-helix transcriptional regulator [Acutalibacteraceae bacterium]|nr:helix-turn-helix transcriptional regulator [Acutalibacteraceae bacterium]
MNKTDKIEVQDILCKNLKFLRECFELTQQQVASELHIDRSTYTYWEVGTSTPSIFKLTTLIEFYKKRGVKLDYNLLLENLITSSIIKEISE